MGRHPLVILQILDSPIVLQSMALLQVLAICYFHMAASQVGLGGQLVAIILHPTNLFLCGYGLARHKLDNHPLSSLI